MDGVQLFLDNIEEFNFLKNAMGLFVAGYDTRLYLAGSTTTWTSLGGETEIGFGAYSTDDSGKMITG